MAAKYLNVAKLLRREVRRMRTEQTVKLPPEAELCRRYDCSRQTVRAALAVLEQEGLIVKKHGSGSYISDTVSGSSRQVVFIAPDTNEYIYPSIVRDMRRTLEDKGYSLTCLDTDNRILNERDIFDRLLAEPPAGMIIEAMNNVLPCMNTVQLRRLYDLGIPVVYLHNSYSEPEGAVCIGQDNFGGGYEAVRYLASKGHKNIAGIMKSDSVSGIERYRGCVQASLDLGLNFQENYYYWFSSETRKRLLENSSDVLGGFIQEFLAPCSAVICYNDEIAYRLIRIMRSNHLDVPRQMAVVSFDNSYYCTAGDVGITSLGHDAHAAGTQAANALLALLSGASCRSVTLPWILTERESV